MRNVLTGRGKRLWAAAFATMFFVVTFRVLGALTTVDAAALPAVTGFYTTFTIGSLSTVVSLLGLDGLAKQIIPALKGGSQA